jgi:hypothetical protein
MPIKLFHTAANFFMWKIDFSLLFHEYDLLDHIDGTVDLLTMLHDPDWSTINATIIRWFFQTVSTNIFHTVVHDGDTAHDVRKKIIGLFTDNKIQSIRSSSVSTRTTSPSTPSACASRPSLMSSTI